MKEQLFKPEDKPDDLFRMYASPVGAAILQKANRIIEDFPTHKYLLFLFIFFVEIISAFGFALYLTH